MPTSSVRPAIAKPTGRSLARDWRRISRMRSPAWTPPTSNTNRMIFSASTSELWNSIQSRPCTITAMCSAEKIDSAVSGDASGQRSDVRQHAPNNTTPNPAVASVVAGACRDSSNRKHNPNNIVATPSAMRACRTWGLSFSSSSANWATSMGAPQLGQSGIPSSTAALHPRQLSNATGTSRYPMRQRLARRAARGAAASTARDSEDSQLADQPGRRAEHCDRDPGQGHRRAGQERQPDAIAENNHAAGNREQHRELRDDAGGRAAEVAQRIGHHHLTGDARGAHDAEPDPLAAGRADPMPERRRHPRDGEQRAQRGEREEHRPGGLARLTVAEIAPG